MSSQSINPANLYKIELTFTDKVLATFTERLLHHDRIEPDAIRYAPTMTAMIDRLIQNGLVNRERDEGDWRECWCGSPRMKKDR
jgi:hypothetical protein